MELNLRIFTPWVDVHSRSKLMSKVGVESFSIRDLIRPEAPQVRRILSAIINFAKFREERMSVYEQCTQKAVGFSFFGKPDE